MANADRDAVRTRVLFVCLGNICRSPLAEGVFLHLVREAGLDHRFEVDSAGTCDWHVGERPDARATAVARKHGVELPSRARQVTPDDLDTFDHVLAMDRENLRDLRRLARASARANIRLLRAHDAAAAGEADRDVPDPYYGGPSGFDLVYEMVHRSCAALLAELTANE
ncbi:MAG: low molecular weight phosphotyrosine protein phosphatase [Gemmatimonadetes bacterium]|nr:low molecular weight phosphotyrosine protein phosphatase [Gemmatimonadota bacterium]